jgi:amino acid transporter
VGRSKRLTLFDCIAIGINGIVGSGIFLLPRWVGSGALAYGPLAFLACGALCTLVALCYAEVGGMFERSGGTYLYAGEAFGEGVGFGVGWLVLVSAILGYATVARGLGDEVARRLALPPGTAALLSAGLIFLLGAANWRGVKTGARFSDALTIAKVAALALFVVVGLFFVRPESFAQLGTPTLPGFAEGTFSALFALSGFEFVAVVAGETENPRRNIPLAIVGSLVGAVVLYSLIQMVAGGVLGKALTTTDAALVESARSFGGNGAATAISVISIISMIGFCSGSALVGPQLFASLASDGVLPAWVARKHPSRNTPHVAIALVTVLAMAAAVIDFKELTDLTIITLFCQYVPTCLAVIVFRRWRPDAHRVFRVPLGSTLPLLALGLMGILITRIEWRSLRDAGIILVVGIIVLQLTRASALRRRAPSNEKAPGS